MFRKNDAVQEAYFMQAVGEQSFIVYHFPLRMERTKGL